MSSREQGFVPASLEALTQVSRLSDSVYAADLAPELCVGSVPNGGYVASVILRVANEHLSPRGQGDTLHIQIQYLRRTRAGQAYLVVDEVKLGRNTSTLHISLHQDSLLPTAPYVGAKPSLVAAYVINADLAHQRGISLPTSWALPHPPPPVDLSVLSADQDAHWAKMQLPIMQRVPSIKTLDFFAPRTGRHLLPSTQDYWVRCANGEPITATALGFVADAAGAFIPETYRQKDASRPAEEGELAHSRAYWYPTLSMGIEVKKKLPRQGVEWLRMRIASKAIQNGRYDLDIILFDQDGELVALSNHVAMVLDFSRNLNGRNRPGGKI